MKIVLSDLVSALSVALDYVEQQLLGVSNYHGRRIACLSYRMGRAAGLTTEECVALAEAAILHDSALEEFIEDERYIDESGRSVPKHDEQFMTKHCTAGERNIAKLPFYPLAEGVVLYHHECADGSGAFGLTAEETPLKARLVHIADMADAVWDLGSLSEDRYGEVYAWVRSQEGKSFDSDCAEIFLRSCTPAVLKSVSGTEVLKSVAELLDEEGAEVSVSVLMEFSTVFAQITDYKSRFTCRHSQGIAEKALVMAKYYGWDGETAGKLYVAGALHDIGKLMIDSDILEKAGKLTEDEFAVIKNHAMGTYAVLHKVRGMEDICSWASLHHEKLDGSGYPFGKSGAELGYNERLLACLDIYQALVEERPYKPGLGHAAAVEIMRDMADHGKLDGGITEDVDRCFSI